MNTHRADFPDKRPGWTRPPLGGDRSMAQAARLLDEHAGKVTGAIGDLSRLLDDLAPKVIGTQTVALNSDGQATAQYRVPFRALCVDHQGSVSAVKFTPANPAAGQPLIFTLPYPASIISATYTYTASATVGTRFTLLQILDPTGAVVDQVQTSSGTVASTSVNPFLSGSPLVAQAAQFSSYVPLPITSPLPAGFAIELTAAGGMVAGDTITGAIFELAPTTLSGTPPPLLVAAGPLTATPAGPGVGVATVRRGGMAVCNLRAYVWSIYGGNPGDLVTVTAFANPQSPSVR